jgi:GDP-D-mannose dehydratase
VSELGAEEKLPGRADLNRNPRQAKMKKAVITGITGQDGAHLAQFFADMSFDQPVATGETTGIGPLNLLELCQMMVEADLRRNEAGFSF